MAQQYDPGAMNMIAQIVGIGGNGTNLISGARVSPEMIKTDALGGVKPEEHGFVQNARAQARGAAIPN